MISSYMSSSHKRQPQGAFVTFVKDCAKTMLHPNTSITQAKTKNGYTLRTSK